MKIAAIGLLLCSLAITSYAQIDNFSHIIVIVQENRTPDNLFQGLCTAPFGSPASCVKSPIVTEKKYNIQTGNWQNGSHTVQPTSVPLANNYDLGHSHSDFEAMCKESAGVCKMGGAAGVVCSPAANCPKNPQFRFVDNSTGILDPYLQLATQYGWSNYMFQTNQGPSFPAHQFLFGATSAPSKTDDEKGIFAAENMENTGIGGTAAAAGCTAPNGPPSKIVTRVKLIDSAGSETALAPVYPCFEHKTIPDVLPGPVTWRYYAPSATSIWTAPNAIRHICVPSVKTGGGECTGSEWLNNVDLTPADVLEDIADCNLSSVSWVIPTGYNSDHAESNDGGGPSWVAAIVNAIGYSKVCDDNTGYWKNTAIFITWDDWGGWYDHERPTILTSIPNQGGYQYGFRVPLIVVSAYTPKGYINNDRHDFGSILRFVEQNFGVEEGELGFADKRATTDLTGYFDLKSKPRLFQEIKAQRDAEYFLNDTRPPTDPDTD
jgi:hypothetical protein